MAIDFVSNNPKVVLNTNIALQSIFSFAFTICAVVLAREPNAGFSAVFTSIIYVAFVTGSHYVVNQLVHPILLGYLAGVSFVMIFISLMTAIYWGELAKCDKPRHNISMQHFMCNNKPAYRAICTFAVFMFLLQMAFVAMLMVYKDLLAMGAATRYDRLSTQDADSEPSYVMSVPGKYYISGEYQRAVVTESAGPEDR